MANTLHVKTGTCTYTFLQGNVAEQVHPNAGGRRIGNAHLADTQDATALGNAVVNQ